MQRETFEERQERERRAFEARISREARRFDLRPLLELLRERGYAREDILFEGTRETSSSGSMIESVTFSDKPPRRIVITLNVGLLADGTLLPSYFLEVVEESPKPERFYDFIRFFDHRLIENFVLAVYPEDEGGPFGDYDRTLRSYFRLFRPDSVSTLAWLFRRYLPEHDVRVTRQAFENTTATHAFLTGQSLLDGTGILGRIYPSEAAGFVVTITVEDETDDRGRPWPWLLRARLEGRILPLLEPFRIPLLVRLVVLNHGSWVKLDDPSAVVKEGYLGYERLRDKQASKHTVIIYRGVPGEKLADHGGKSDVFLYKNFVDPSVTGELEDIVRNLRYVLGTKRGTGYFLRSFGLSSGGHRTRDEMVMTLKAEIEENIRLFEPRVELAEVAEVLDDDEGAPLLVATMRVPSDGSRIRLTAHLAKRTFDLEILEPAKKGGEGG